MFELMKQLTELSGPVGQEQAVLDFVEQLWAGLGAHTERTRVGNLLGRAGGNGPRLLLIAHADELCYLVRAIDPGGFLWLANGQGWERRTSIRNWFYVGQRVRVMARSGDIPGVIGSATGHAATLVLPDPGEMNWNDFWVDTGLSRDELLAAGVTPGTRVIWDAETVRQGNHIVGKALDDRVPLAVVSEVIRRVPAEQRRFDITAACSIQEEVGLIGAFALALTRGGMEPLPLLIGLVAAQSGFWVAMGIFK